VGAEVVVTSSAAAALSINQTVVSNTGNFPELTDFFPIYDEMRVLAIHYAWTAYVLTPSSGVNNATMALAIEFDPSISGPSTYAQVLESSHHTGPYLLSSGSTGGGSLQPSLKKYELFSAKMPGPLAPIVASDCPGSAWYAVDVTAPVLAVLNGYITALGTAGVTQLRFTPMIDVEFRMRT